MPLPHIELVDLYPTLGALAGLPDPHTLGESVNGTSLAPLFFKARSECDEPLGDRPRLDDPVDGSGLQRRKSDNREGACRADYVAGGTRLKDAAFAQFAKTCAGYLNSCSLHNLTYVCVCSASLRHSYYPHQ